MRIERAADATERVVICRTFFVLCLKNEFMGCPEDTIKAVGYVGSAGMKQPHVKKAAFCKQKKNR